MNMAAETSKRVLHVALTDAEFRAFKIAALDAGKTMGDLVADALRSTYNLNGEPRQ